LRGSTPTLSILVFPTSTRTALASPTSIAPTETPFMTGTPAPPRATFTLVRSGAPLTIAPIAVPSGTSVFALPAPVLKEPTNNVVLSGEGQKMTALTFKWTWDCPQCTLGPNDKFIITISFVHKDTGRTMFMGDGVTQNPPFITMNSIMIGTPFEVYSQAKENLYTWTVQVKRGEQPISPPSETWKFTWK